MKQEILSNEEVAPGIFRMSIAIWGKAKDFIPGQFVHVRCSSRLNPLLRRPFSVHKVNSNSVEILYKVVGMGTKLLSEEKPGNELDITGPLGQGFSVRDSTEPVMILAGGMGVAPTLFLAHFLKNPWRQVLIGAKNDKCVLCEEEFRKIGCSVMVTTDDGSYGRKGYLSCLFEELMREKPPAFVYACGPVDLLREVAAICNIHKTPCEVSFENHMACGVGACLGCVIAVKTENGIGYKRVCREGPVFKADAIAWDNLVA